MKTRHNILKPELIYLILAILVYIIAVFTLNMHNLGGEPFYLRAIEPVFSPASVLELAMPIIPILIAYQIIDYYWFTSVKEWTLVRIGSSKQLFKKELAILSKKIGSYTLLAWLFSCLTLYLQSFLLNYRNFPVTTGVISEYGSGFGIIILLMAAFLTNLAIALLTVVFTFIANKKWQVLVGSVLTEMVLPILLFEINLLPENLMPINILNQLIIAESNKQTATLTAFAFLAVVLLVEGLIITLCVKVRDRKGY